MDIKFFKAVYEEKEKHREKFLMLEKKPEPGKPFTSMFAVELSNPYIEGFGGIYGSRECPYGGCLPKETKIDEISLEEFLDNVRKSIERNYVEKKGLKDIAETIVFSDHFHRH